MTQDETENKIKELEAWLEKSHPEHESRPTIEADLRKLKQKQNRHGIE